MILLWFTAGVVPAVLLGVYLPWSAWVLPVGLGRPAILQAPLPGPEGKSSYTSFSL